MIISKSILSAMVVCIMIAGSISWAGVNEDLIKAADIGDIKTVKISLENGANVNAQNDNGITALIFAAR